MNKNTVKRYVKEHGKTVATVAVGGVVVLLATGMGFKVGERYGAWAAVTTLDRVFPDMNLYKCVLERFGEKK